MLEFILHPSLHDIYGDFDLSDFDLPIGLLLQ